MCLPFVAARLGRGGAYAAASSAPAATASSLVDGEQDVIDLSPAAWWDASYDGAITESGGAVSKWTSREGNDLELVQATADRQPAFTASNSDFNDYSTMKFDSTATSNGQFLANDGTVYVDTSGNVGTIFYVGEEPPDGESDSAARIVNWSRGGWSCIGTSWSTYPLFTYKPINGVGTSGQDTDKDPYVAVVSIDGASSYATINDEAKDTFTADAGMTSTSYAKTSVGGYDYSSENSSTTAAEFIIFNTALSDADVATVKTYLSNKYTGGSGF